MATGRKQTKVLYVLDARQRIQILSLGNVRMTGANKKLLCTTGDRAGLLKANPEFVDKFEGAINALRLGHVDTYNLCAVRAGFATVERKTRFPYLPLCSDNLKEALPVWQTWCDDL